MAKQEFSDSETKKPKERMVYVKRGGRFIPEDPVQAANFPPAQPHQPVKWTDEEKAALVRMKDDEGKLWKEIADGGLFGGGFWQSLVMCYSHVKGKRHKDVSLTI